MFYLGGMTLGYLAPPPPKAMKPVRQTRTDVDTKASDSSTGEECDRNQEWARAFLTPWHLLY
ncbi:MAG TPA: hypothetical protein VGO04_21940 [Ensifer sp.]|jgi:hypothetical protein|uniref:hypothetical protein n=1 Tax=Ensifer sp. TaxID=1872086 RepID=UPI002E0FCDD9|nr:hypothetical protein [Ensifer sp.]